MKTKSTKRRKTKEGNMEEAKIEETQSENALAKDSILKPIGDLTIFEASQFHEDLNVLHGQVGSLELNLSEVGRMDSSCMQLIVAATRTGRLTLTGYSHQIRDRFEQIGFAKFLPTEQRVT
jgi:anti-anti-sigma regulatory factor